MPPKNTGIQSKRALRQLEDRFVGVSAATQHVRELVARVSTTDATVLIQGESGTGKEVVAQLVHDLSDRSRGPFIPINCGAIPGELLESELLGHEKGSFTGAVAARKGRFELAEGGTLFLDEIGDMPFSMQVKLLRVLQEKSYERVGGIKSIPCNVRIIAATHQNLESKIEENLFRADLYYRLSIFPIEIPPLRERHGDIATLITAFLKSSKAKGRGSLEFSGDALAQLEAYDWPGNVRELINFIHRVLLTTSSEVIEAEETREVMGQSATPLDAVEEKNAWRDFGQPLRTAREHFERDYLEFHLLQTRGNISELARRAELERTHLYRKLKGLGLNPKDEKYRQ